MIFIFIILLLSPLAGALMARFAGKKVRLSDHLIFTGSYLFSLTIIHLLPDVFTNGGDRFVIGLMVLAGFFLQQILELFSKGIEHGHMHAVPQQQHFGLLIGLSVHAILEGALLLQPSGHHHSEHVWSLFLGIILHKIPAGFALMTVLLKQPTGRLWTFLILFALASPLGMILSKTFVSADTSTFTYLYALVTGSFLHISTTIFVEANPSHHLALRKILISAFGALLAVSLELFL